MNLSVRIDDAKSVDYHTRFHSARNFLGKGRNTVTIWLSDVTAKLDIEAIKRLILFSSNVRTPTTFYVDNIRLEKRK